MIQYWNLRLARNLAYRFACTKVGLASFLLNQHFRIEQDASDLGGFHLRDQYVLCIESGLSNEIFVGGVGYSSSIRVATQEG